MTGRAPPAAKKLLGPSPRGPPRAEGRPRQLCLPSSRVSPESTSLSVLLDRALFSIFISDRSGRGAGGSLRAFGIARGRISSGRALGRGRGRPRGRGGTRQRARGAGRGARGCRGGGGGGGGGAGGAAGRRPRRACSGWRPPRAGGCAWRGPPGSWPSSSSTTTGRGGGTGRTAMGASATHRCVRGGASAPPCRLRNCPPPHPAPASPPLPTHPASERRA